MTMRNRRRRRRRESLARSICERSRQRRLQVKQRFIADSVGVMRSILDKVLLNPLRRQGVILPGESEPSPIVPERSWADICGDLLALHGLQPRPLCQRGEPVHLDGGGVPFPILPLPEVGDWVEVALKLDESVHMSGHVTNAPQAGQRCLDVDGNRYSLDHWIITGHRRRKPKTRAVVYGVDPEAERIAKTLVDAKEAVVKKIHAERREGKWRLTLCERLDGWWLIVANRDGGGVHDYLFRPEREEDARKAFDVSEQSLDEIHGAPAGTTLQ